MRIGKAEATGVSVFESIPTVEWGDDNPAVEREPPKKIMKKPAALRAAPAVMDALQPISPVMTPPRSAPPVPGGTFPAEPPVLRVEAAPIIREPPGPFEEQAQARADLSNAGKAGPRKRKHRPRFKVDLEPGDVERLLQTILRGNTGRSLRDCSIALLLR